jgi:large repetitive protein
VHTLTRRSRIALLSLLLLLFGLGVQAPAAFAAFDIALAPPVAVDDAITVKSGTELTFDVLGNDTGGDGDPLELASPLGSVTTPHGTIECNFLGSCTYTSDDGYLGEDGFEYIVSDGEETDTGFVAITVATNTPPQATDDQLEVLEGTQGTVYVLGNDFDPDFDSLEVTSPAVGAPLDTPHGTVTCDEFADCLYTPDPAFTGTDGFDYTISDGNGGSDMAHVTITVNVNEPPFAADDTAPRSDQTVLDVLRNDEDPDGGPLEITSVTAPAFGTATINDSPDSDTITYSQTANFGASDSFTYTVTDSGGDTATATVTLEPCPAVASSLDHGGLVVSERWAMCSATRANAAAGPTTTVLTPSGGSSALLTSGDAALAPGPNDSSGAGVGNGTEGRGAFDPSILRLDLVVPAGANCLSFDFAFQSEEYPEYVNQGFNDGFLAELDVSDWSVGGDSEIIAPHNFAFDSTGAIVSVNSSFFEPGRVIEDTGSQYDGSTRLLSVRTPVTPGAHVLYLSIFDAGDGILDSAAFVDRLQASAAGAGGCSAGANEPPAAVNDSLMTGEDTPSAPLNVLANDSDPDAHPLTVTTLNPSADHGTVSCTAAGVCTYTPDANYFGPDSFTYTISDGHGGTDTATVSITVTPVNDAPNAVDDSLTTAQGTAGNVNVLANDSDLEGDSLTVTTLSPSADHGTVSCTAAGVCTYTPNAGYSGPDSFEYSISDGYGGTDTATVSVTVTPAGENSQPLADDDTLTTPEDTPGSLNVLEGDTDPDGNALSVTTLAPSAAHGTVACEADGDCTYTPAPNYNGGDGFDYTVSDGNGGTDMGHVSITVTPVNDPPNAVNDSLTTAEDTVANLNVLANDSDDGAFQLVSNTQPAHGSAACTVAGDCTYTPTAGYHGPDSFTYKIGDGQASDAATVNVTVSADANTAPSCANVKPSKTKLWPPQHQFVLVSLSGATDADGDPLTYAITKVTQDEKVTKAISKDDKGPDAKRVAGKPHQIKLRAERIGDGNGRVYRIRYTVSDGQGGKCSGVEKVGVPRNKNGNAIDNTGKTYNSFG